MKRFNYISVLLSILISGIASHNVSYISSFVYQSGNPCDEYCDPRRCCSNSDCHKLDFQMKCVSGWCTCPDNKPFNGRCLTDKTIGEACSVSAECMAIGGYCESGVCQCYNNHVEFRGNCYKGYKAIVDMEFSFSVSYLREVQFYVSDDAEEYQLRVTDNEGSLYTFYFNEESEVTGDTINQVSIHKLEVGAPFEITLCAVEYDPPSAVNSVSFGKDRFEVEVGIYDFVADDFDITCAQVCSLYFLDPEEITISRTGTQATADIDFHPLTHKLKLTAGDLDDPCTSDDDCKPLGSVCVDDVCVCDNDHTKLPNNYCCVPMVNGLGTSCSVADQCAENNAVCSGKSICECDEGFVEDLGACVPMAII